MNKATLRHPWPNFLISRKISFSIRKPAGSRARPPKNPEIARAGLPPPFWPSPSASSMSETATGTAAASKCNCNCNCTCTCTCPCRCAWAAPTSCSRCTRNAPSSQFLPAAHCAAPCESPWIRARGPVSLRAAVSYCMRTAPPGTAVWIRQSTTLRRARVASACAIQLVATHSQTSFVCGRPDAHTARPSQLRFSPASHRLLGLASRPSSGPWCALVLLLDDDDPRSFHRLSRLPAPPSPPARRVWTAVVCPPNACRLPNPAGSASLHRLISLACYCVYPALELALRPPFHLTCYRLARIFQVQTQLALL